MLLLSDDVVLEIDVFVVCALVGFVSLRIGKLLGWLHPKTTGFDIDIDSIHHRSCFALNSILKLQYDARGCGD